MTPRSFLDGKVALHPGDCRDVLRALPDCSIDSVVTDPPYALVSIVKRFGGKNAAPAKDGDVYARSSAGFMGKQWDTGETAFAMEFWTEVLRVLKPGGHLVAFSGTRTYHRMVCAIEDAGFEIRDQIGWAYGSGFPKSHDVSKGIDKLAGVERQKIAVGAPVKRMIPGADQNSDGSWIKDNGRLYQPGIEVPATEAAMQWNGWGTALKPAWEPICLARKSLDGTVARNVLVHGVGGLNIDGCRVDASARPLRELDAKATNSNVYAGRTGDGGLGKGLDGGSKAVGTTDLGRWPANLVHDGSDEVLACFPDSPGQQGDLKGTEPSRTGDENTVAYGKYNERREFKARRDGEASANRRYTENGGTDFAALPGMRRSDGASAARFFYTSKADADDRLGSKHPTVKPLDLMQWLVRLVTPKGGTCLDPFAGTGTTGEAAWREGCRAILIEREEEYQADIARRMELAANPTKRAAVAATKNKLEDPNTLPLFSTVKAAE